MMIQDKWHRAQDRRRERRKEREEREKAKVREGKIVDEIDNLVESRYEV